jgi:hypothetical protein
MADDRIEDALAKAEVLIARSDEERTVAEHKRIHDAFFKQTTQALESVDTDGQVQILSFPC